MKSAWFVGNRKIEIRDIPEPTLKDGEVMVAITKAALCGSELHQFFTATKEHLFVGGHELCGVVVGKTSDVNNVKIGQKIVIYPAKGCGHCFQCERGNISYCLANGKEKYAIGFTRNGGFAEKIAIDYKMCLPIPDDIDDEIGCLLVDVFGTTYHNISKLKIKENELVGIIGLGPLGIGASKVCMALGAKVIGIDINEYRIGLAKKIGVDKVINSKQENLKDKIMEISNNYGLNAIIEATGNSKVAQQAMELLGVEGRIGFLGENSNDVCFKPSAEMMCKELTFFGSRAFRIDEFTTIIKIAKKMQKEARSIITHRFSLEQVQEAFDVFATGNTGKVVLNIK